MQNKYAKQKFKFAFNYKTNDFYIFFCRMSLPGLPPLPKSLSGVELTGVHQLHNSTPAFSAADSIRGVSPLARMPTTLDTQLAVLRREMVSFVYIIK